MKRRKNPEKEVAAWTGRADALEHAAKMADERSYQGPDFSELANDIGGDLRQS